MKFAYSEQPHPVFEQPTDPAVRLWRYTNLSKFLSLLDTASLYFARVDTLGDPFEGSTTSATLELRRAAFASQGLEETPQGVQDRAERLLHLRRCTAVNCWHMNDLESAAMWRLYLSADEGIAVQSTFRRLIQALPRAASELDKCSTIFVGKVRYIDYNTASIPETNMFWPFLHKRRSFEHEREVRALVQPLPTVSAWDGPVHVGGKTQQGLRFLDRTVDSITHGVAIPVDLNTLVESVYISPTSPAWFGDVVKSLIQRYGYNFPTHQSDLNGDPIF